MSDLGGKMKWLLKNKWMILFIFVILVLILFPDLKTTVKSEFWNNLIPGLLISLAVLFINLHFMKLTDLKIDRITEVARASEEKLTKREKILEIEQKIEQFDEFMKRETYHGARFPDIKEKEDELGLEYIIEPCRDPNGFPIKNTTEGHSWYVVRIKEIAYQKEMEEKDLEPYKKAPIKLGEYYYCDFISDDWHMSQCCPWPGGEGSYRFYLSSKVGPSESIEPANDFMGCSKMFENMTKIETLYLDSKKGGEYDCYYIYQDGDGKLFVRIHNSPPKRIFNLKMGLKQEKFTIENIEGHAHGTKLKNIKNNILEVLNKNNIIIPNEQQW